MMNPDKVKNFLDVTGQWDPSLLLVMGGALIISALAFRKYEGRRRIGKNKSTNEYTNENEVCPPTAGKIDSKLIIGSIIFGIGWAIGGICPGPAIANLATFSPQIVAFVVAMVIGIGCVRLLKLG